MTDPMLIGYEDHPLADQFIAELASMPSPKVLELGTRRWVEDFPTHHRAWAPANAMYLMGDVEAGTDVDVIVDAHDLSPLFKDDETDAYISVAMLEHCRHAWVVAQEAFRILRPGGILYCQTHMAFMRHSTYGGDFGRWTSDGLSALFEWAGFETVGASMTYPVRLEPLRQMSRWNEAAASDAWLCVDGYFRKPSITSAHGHQVSAARP